MSRLSTTNTEVPGLESDRINRKYLPCAHARSFQQEIILVMALFECDGVIESRSIVDSWMLCLPQGCSPPTSPTIAWGSHPQPTRDANKQVRSLSAGCQSPAV